MIADPGAFLSPAGGGRAGATGPGLARPVDQWPRRQVAALAAAHLAESPWCEAHLIGDLLAALPAGDGLFCANSLPIRQLDTWSGTRPAPLAVFGNRGVSGIDGQASTLAGLNAAGVPTLGLLGDLSLAHDLSGLLLAGRLRRPLVVLNNGGGRIFDYLPQHGLPGFEALWRTPMDLDLADLARTFRLAHRRVSDGEGFRRALAEGLAAPGPRLIEVMHRRRGQSRRAPGVLAAGGPSGPDDGRLDDGLWYDRRPSPGPGSRDPLAGPFPTQLVNCQESS